MDIFKWVKNTSQFNEDFMKKYNGESDQGYFLEVGVPYLQELHELHKGLSFLPERMKVEKVEKLVANLHDKKEYLMHIWHLKQALSHWLILGKVPVYVSRK